MSEIFLLPGQMAVLKEPGTIKTVLGSCVAVVLFDRQSGVGGMNHYLLPEPTDRPAGELLRYGSYAVPALLHAVLDAGASYERLEAEVYGGGAVVATLRGDFQIGQHNIELARRLLQEWEVSVMAADVGGRSGRKVALSMPSCKTRAERIVSAS